MYANAQIIPLKLFQEWGMESKEIGERGKYKYDIFDTL
jgi:hypothetical protein